MMPPPDTRLSIVLHDYGRYPFTLALAKALAGRGHRVRYLYGAKNPTPSILGGRAEIELPGLEIVPVFARLGLTKNNFILRWLQEREYGVRLAQELQYGQADVVLSANTPLDSQARFLAAAHSAGIAFVYWHQDLVGEATRSILSNRLGKSGEMIGRYYSHLEARLLELSDHVVSISDQFSPALRRAGVGPGNCEVIENWADLEAIQPGPRDNAWALQNGLGQGVNLLYAGTLGYKHPAPVLLDLATRLRAKGDASVIVVSEGPQANKLAAMARHQNTPSLRVLPFQPEDRFSLVLASGDVLLAVLSDDASRYSVPSKVLAYLCAGRPILMSAGRDNPAARLIEGAEAGFVVRVGDVSALFDKAAWLCEHPTERAAMGERGRALAERRFALEPIVDRFENLLMRTAHRLQPHRS